MASQVVISVLLTAHNCEHYLADTLASLKNACAGVQDAVEFILVNDASTDKTSEILHRFAADYPSGQVFDIAFKNIGKVRNFGVAQCSGQYITMLDGDDQLLPHSFRDIVNCLQKAQPDALLAALNEVYENRHHVEKWQGLTLTSLTQHQAIEKFLIHRDLQAHFIGQFIRREILSSHPFPEFICYEDAYLFPEILVSCDNILYATLSPYLYFKRNSSLSNTLNSEKISLLIKATQHMDDIFHERYRNLLSCHWINIAHKYRKSDFDRHDQAVVETAIKKIRVLSFLGDSKVRTSFKKKLIKMKLKQRLPSRIKKAP